MRAEILKIHAVTPEVSLIKYAAEQIQAGHVLGMPTDTFYGLAADPFNLHAVDRVYEIKTRSRHKPLLSQQTAYPRHARCETAESPGPWRSASR